MTMDEGNIIDPIDDEAQVLDQETSGDATHGDTVAGMSGAELSRAIDVEIAKLA